MANRKHQPGMVYEWGRQAYGVKAQVVGEAVAALVARAGACQPADLVEIARADDSPLHPLFTWDDRVAADRWRAHEARNVINCLVVQMGDGDASINAPAFVSVGHAAETMGAGVGYRPVSVVMADPSFGNEALREALAQLNAVRRRYQALEQLSPVWAAIDQIAAD